MPRMGLEALNNPSLAYLADALRDIKGPNTGLGALLNQIIDRANDNTTAAATATLTVGGVFSAASTLTATVDGTAVAHVTVAGDTDLNGAAEALKVKLAANATVAAAYTVTRANAVITFTTKRKGASGNAATLVAANAGGTTTLTASGATFANGVGTDDVMKIVAGDVIL